MADSSGADGSEHDRQSATGQQKGPRRVSCACLPLANAEGARRGPLLGGNANEQHAGQCRVKVDQTGPTAVRAPGGFPPAVENPVDKVWRTGGVLWITPCARHNGRVTPPADDTDAYEGPGRGAPADRLPPRAQPGRDLQGQGVPVRGGDDPAAGRGGRRAGPGRDPARAAGHRRLDRRGHRGRRRRPDARPAGQAGARVRRAAGAGGRRVRSALRGDLHSHSDWSDGGSPIEEMAFTAIELGHDYLVLTDHSPRLTVANGLSVARLTRQLGVVEAINEHLGGRATAGSGCSRASRSTSSTTARSTRPTRCWPGSTYAWRRCTPSSRWTRRAMTRRMVAGGAQPVRQRPRPLHRAGWSPATAGCAGSRSSTPRRCSGRARSRVRRWRSTRGPSGATRRRGC